MIKTIISAIESRKEINFTYDGLPRIAQPAAIGESSNGNVVMRCYQTHGRHITPGHEWDLCTVSNIGELEITADSFRTDPPHYKRGDKHMRQIYAQL